MPGAYRTYRTALTKASKKFSNGSLACKFDLRQLNTAPVTKRKQKAFSAKTTGAPHCINRNPPRAGPIMPDRFNWRPPRVTADGSSAGETISGIKADQAGERKLKPAPALKTATRMIHGFNALRKPNIASIPAQEANQRFITERILRRSTISARAPAGMVSRKKGREATVDISEIMNGELETV